MQKNENCKLDFTKLGIFDCFLHVFNINVLSKI